MSCSLVNSTLMPGTELRFLGFRNSRLYAPSTISALRDHNGVVHVGDDADLRAGGDGEQARRDLRPPLHAIGDAVNAGLQLMLGHQVEVSAFVGHRVFAAEISHGIEFVISLGFADLHGFQRRPVYADTHLHAGRGNRQHAFDAACQCAGVAVLGRVHGAADQPRVDLGAIASPKFLRLYRVQH
mgnify:CR=1 FL=1